MYDRTGQSSGDAVHLLDSGDHHAAEFVDRFGPGPDDDVIGTGDVLGLDDSVDRGDHLRYCRGLADLGLDQDVRLYHVTSRAASRIMWEGGPRYRVVAHSGETRAVPDPRI